MTVPSPTPASPINGPHGRLAIRQVTGTGPGFVWLGGFRSDMLGSKAERVSDWARTRGRAFTRFDYSGHGESDGLFADGTISSWLADAQCVLDRATEGAQVLIGSSMGGWIAMLLAARKPDRVAGLVLIAPAPDFTESLLWPSLDASQRQTLLETGRIEQPSDYSDEPEIITKALIDDGRRHLILDTDLSMSGPVRILQGMCDDVVPFEHALRIPGMVNGDDVVVTLVKNGDHRLSSEEDLRRLEATLDAIAEQLGG